MNKSILSVALGAASLLAVLSAQAQQITVVNFGGANANAQKKAYYEPFAKTGTQVVPVEYNGEQAKIKAMVETKKVTWDVVEVESPDVARGCDEGLFEKLDYSKLGGKADLLPAAVSECGIGIFVWSTVMAYNADKLKGTPTTWADFWDLKKFPGKRGMRKGARYNLEFALMADGVKPGEVYKVLATKEGAERAFKKLTELKPSIQWWEAGAQPPQFLVAGDVVLTTVYNGRIDAANREGKQPQDLPGPGGIYDLDYWAIPKGSPNKDAALKFIAFGMHDRANQAVYATEHRLRPGQHQGPGQAGQAKVLDDLPTSPATNAKDALQFSVEVLGRPGRGPGKALCRLGHAVTARPRHERARHHASNRRPHRTCTARPAPWRCCRKALSRADRHGASWRAFALTLPLLVFLLLTLLVPIVALLQARGGEPGGRATPCPRTITALKPRGTARTCPRRPQAYAALVAGPGLACPKAPTPVPWRGGSTAEVPGRAFAASWAPTGRCPCREPSTPEHLKAARNCLQKDPRWSEAPLLAAPSPRTAPAGRRTTSWPRSTCSATPLGQVERMPEDSSAPSVASCCRTFHISAGGHAVLPAAGLPAGLVAGLAAGPLAPMC